MNTYKEVLPGKLGEVIGDPFSGDLPGLLITDIGFKITEMLNASDHLLFVAEK